VSSARAWRFAGALCGVVVILDQAAKALVEANMYPGQDVGVLGPIGITLSHNSGVAFGLASGGGTRLVLVTALALGVVGYLFSRDPIRPGMWVAAGLLAGGAIGNLADRIRVDAVTDYVAIGNWPAFNLADVAVTAGVLLLAYAYVREPQ
jgi:signal peptidase II